MRNFTMRRLLLASSVLLLMIPALLVGCSNDYDDSKLWKDVNDLKERLAAIEEQVSVLNGEIEVLRKAVNKMIYIVKVEEISEGYLITFTDNSTITIKNGKTGAAGANAPVVGVKQDTDGVYYWTLTTAGVTDWLKADGQKLRVTSERVIPILGVDADGFWTISYDGGTTTSQILDVNKNPISALGQGGSGDSLFKGVTQDDNNVYFELSNGSIITVAKRNGFYMLIRKAPETATLVYGETQVYEVEAVGVTKTAITKPDEWKVSYAENKLSITAPTKDHSTCSETQGTVSIIYFSANGQSDMVSMKVVVESDYRGETVGDDFTINITEIGDKTVKATITPEDKVNFWYATAYDKAKYDAAGEAAYLAEQMEMFTFYVQNEYMWGYLDAMLHTGTANYANTTLSAGKELYLAVFSLKVDKNEGTCSAVSGVMTVPFKTKQPVVINTVYRINISDISWYGAKYVTVPSDDLGYFHGFVTKTEFDKYATDADFMKAHIQKYKDYYYDELYMDKTVTWNMLTSTGTQTVVSPSYHPNLQLADGMDDYTKPLVQSTDYYAVSFACEDGDASSPLSKATFRTGKFTSSESCTFEVTTTVERQDITVSVVPSNKSATYLLGLTQASYYDGFEDDLQFSMDDVFWTKVSASENNKTLADYLVKGNKSYTYKDNWAATAYIVSVYGCTADGVITTEPKLVRVLTKGTIDEAKAGAPAKQLGMIYKR